MIDKYGHRIAFPNGKVFAIGKQGQLRTSTTQYLRGLVNDIKRQSDSVICSNPFHAGAFRPEYHGELFCSKSCYKLHHWFSVRILPFFDLIEYDGDLDEATTTESDNLNLESLERAAILKALEGSDNMQVEAAKLLGISPRKLNYKMKLMNIRPVDLPREN